MADAAPQDQEPEAPAAEEQDIPAVVELVEGEDIHARIARVSARVAMLHREGHMRSNKANYDYATIDQLRELLRPLMAAEGITMLPRKVKIRRQKIIERERTGDNGAYTTTQFDTLLEVVWRLSCPWDGETERPTRDFDFTDVPSLGRSLNNSDKDFNTAMTYAERNAFLSAFHLSTGEDPEQDRPEVKGRRITPPRGSSKAPKGEYRAPTAEADPKTEEQQQEAARLRLALGQRLGEMRPEENPDERLRKFINTKAQEIGVSVLDMNRAEFEVILDALREQARKLLPGWNPKTGEWEAGKGPGAPTPADDPEVAPPPGAGEAPAQAQDAPVPAAVPPAVQQAIEGAAAATPLAGAPIDDPDLPAPKPGDTYRESLEQAARHGIEEVRVIEMMMKAGAARPEDLDAGPTQIAFLNLLDAAVNEAWTPEPTDNGQEELS